MILLNDWGGASLQELSLLALVVKTCKGGVGRLWLLSVRLMMLIVIMLMMVIHVGCCWGIELRACVTSTGDGFCQQTTISCQLRCNTGATVR